MAQWETMTRRGVVVFDWDLTLWNGWDLHIQGVGHVADRLGLPTPSPQAVADGYSYYGPFDDNLASLFRHEPEEVIAYFMEYYHARLRELGHLYDGVPKVLANLKEDGYSLAVLSDKRRVYGEPEMELTGIGPNFDLVRFMENGMPYKPDPEGLEWVLERSSVTKDQALFVGDSPVDMECARRAGVKCAAALWGTVSREATLSQGPDYVWHTLSEMAAALTLTA